MRLNNRVKSMLLGACLRLLTTAVVVAHNPPVAAELANIWALDDGTKVKATEIDHTLEAGNGLYDATNRRVSLFGVRNEIVAFQVIIEGGTEKTAGVGVELDSIGPIENGQVSSGDEYYLNRRIEIFAQHYLNITTRSHDLSWEPGSAAEPAGMTGWIPDALVPLSPDDTMTVPAGRNQGVWVDVFIPPATAPGQYVSTLTVKVDGSPCSLPACQLEVELEVLNAVLPDEPTAKTMLYFSGGENDRNQMWSRYSSDPWSDDFADVEAMRMRHHKLGRRHRITMFISGSDEPDSHALGRINGSSFTHDAGYDGPGVGVGQNMFSIHTYGSGTLTSADASTWADWFATHGPNTEYFLYTTDEPGPDDFESINQTASEAEPVPAFVTHEPAAELEVDIYCAIANAYSISAAATAVANGKRVWIYNGVRPFTGTFVSDDVAVSTRVNPLIAFKYNVPRWFYWEATYYDDFQGNRGNVDVFTNPISFTNAWGDEMNGDGLLIYPGRDVVFPDQNHDIDHPLPSIRLKNWRRGIQDVEYLALLAAAGDQALVDNVLATLVPAALDDAGLSAGDAVRWEEDGEAWLAQRRLLANAIKEHFPTDGSSGGGGGGGDGGGDGGGCECGDGGGVARCEKVSGFGCRHCHAGAGAGSPLLALLAIRRLVLRRRRRFENEPCRD